ncbi:transposase-like protein [Streptomyces rishiriensis]|uniref:Mutator family transposase n=1 Tax=Streptomyces rishiriensis TaxID=68264 RepID=A0ABU0NIY2_STRRH|nr:transposase [Streptomyces rishiriensis]MDQ0578788.1 transposase-like protein [Streptomyces rishiriensis]
MADGCHESAESCADLLCDCHKTANVLNAIPTSAQFSTRKALQDIHTAEGREHAVTAAACEEAYGAKWLKATQKITDAVDELLAFNDLPAEHWVRLRTTTPIEPTFTTIRLRTKGAKGAGGAVAAPAMVFKLVESAQVRWGAVNAPHLALVRAGARFERVQLVERADGVAA